MSPQDTAYQERQVKHVRNKKEVEERFNRPVTESQMQTWGRDERYAAMPPCILQAFFLSGSCSLRSPPRRHATMPPCRRGT